MGHTSLHLILIALLSVVLMATVPTLIKFTSASIETMSLVRLAIALLVLTPLVAVKGAFRGLTRQDWLWMLLAGICFALHWWTFAYAIKTAGAGMGAIATSTFGIHLLLLNNLIHRQPVRPVEMLLIAVCVFGCYLVVPETDSDSRVVVGFLVGVLSAFLYGVLPLMHRRLIHLPTLTRTWGQFAFGGLCFLTLWPRTDWNLTAMDWWALLALGAVGTLIAHSLWVKASSELPGIMTGSIYYLHSPMAVTVGWLFLDERITPAILVGMALIIGANLILLAGPWIRLQRRLG
ncbi:MAG: DMT family transporter [Bacteroidales bacterium]|nr:DMT family transporter [Bacteroidales bacterium]